MDLVDFSEEVFAGIQKKFMTFSSNLNLKDVRFIPISALHGDNVVVRSNVTPWYDGPTLMYLLENLYISNDYNQVDARFPVQYVIRPQSNEFHDFRGYAGRMASGTFKIGDRVKVLPSGFTSTIESIRLFNEELDSASAPQSVTITLSDDLDVSRGCMIVPVENGIEAGQDIEVMVCWLSDTPLNPAAKYAVKHTSSDVRCMIKDVKYKVNIDTLDKDYDDKGIGLNDIACVTLRTTKPLFYDSYRQNRVTGSLVLIDEATNITVGAGMII